jgi:hypothetical protein
MARQTRRHSEHDLKDISLTSHGCPITDSVVRKWGILGEKSAAEIAAIQRRIRHIHFYR